MLATYSEQTHDVEVQVLPFYVAEQSNEQAGYYFYAYRITITNRTGADVQLVERRWIIRDGKGKVEEVRGEGVVGEQPWIASAKSFQYVSACPLHTLSGSMRGQYVFKDAAGHLFRVRIPLFFLRHPSTFH